MPRDLDAAEAFYGGLLGFPRVLRAGDRHVFFRVGRTILLIFNPDETERAEPGARFPVPPHGARGPGHVCFAASREDIGLWREKARGRGHRDRGGFRLAERRAVPLFPRPAGNSVEIAEPRLWISP
jgi:catechol 2,3-dioxygenase-like lactoylglutathione lyase family enzyme